MLRACGIGIALLLSGAGSAPAAQGGNGAASQPTATRAGKGNARNTAALTMPTDTRLPVPPAHELIRATRQLQSQFTADYPRDNFYTEREFYQHLFQHYVESGQGGSKHPVLRYAAMMMVVRLAALQASSATLFITLDAMGQNYRVNEYRIMAAAVRKIINRGNIPYYTADNLVQTIASHTSTAISQDHFSSAEALARCGITLARITGQANSLHQFMRMLKTASRAAPFEKKYHAAMKRLENHPHDAVANATVGLFYALFSNQMKLANRHLLLSGDPKLIALAKMGGRARQDSWQSLKLAYAWLRLSKVRAYRGYRRPIKGFAARYASKALGSLDADIVAALQAGHYHRARRLLREAAAVVKHLGLKKFQYRVTQWKLTEHQLALMHHQYHLAISSMNSGSGGAAAYRSIGEYLCFASGRWKQGLMYLKRSPAHAVAEAALLDHQTPKTAAAEKRLGDRWWDISQSYHGLERYNIRSRAIYWYHKAMAGLHGSARSIVVYRDLRFKRESF